MKQHSRHIEAEALQGAPGFAAVGQAAVLPPGGGAGADSGGFLHRSRLPPDK